MQSSIAGSSTNKSGERERENERTTELLFRFEKPEFRPKEESLCSRHSTSVRSQSSYFVSFLFYQINAFPKVFKKPNSEHCIAFEYAIKFQVVHCATSLCMKHANRIRRLLRISFCLFAFGYPNPLMYE